MGEQNEKIEGDNALSTLSGIVGVLVNHVQASAKTFEEITKSLVEQAKKDRFWRNVRTAAYIIAAFGVPIFYASLITDPFTPKELRDGYVAMVRVDGVIASDEHSNALKLVNSLEKAFDDKQAKGVVVLIDSPGGSPVQSAIVHNRLRSLQAEHPKTKLWVVGEDMMTSGAYYIATGANNICVNPATMAGSIGVINESFGLQKVADKYGIERRIYTAGEHKHRMDMWVKMEPQDEAKLHDILSSIHQQFIAAVQEGRGDRLIKGHDDELFSGDFWTGDEAVKRGLADRVCDLPSLLQSEYHVKNVKDYTAPKSIFSGISSSFGTLASKLINESTAVSPQLLPN